MQTMNLPAQLFSALITPEIQVIYLGQGSLKRPTRRNCSHLCLISAGYLRRACPEKFWRRKRMAMNSHELILQNQLRSLQIISL